jgi:hypothetical protein
MPRGMGHSEIFSPFPKPVSLRFFHSFHKFLVINDRVFNYQKLNPATVLEL